MPLHVIVTEDRPEMIHGIKHLTSIPLPKVGDLVEILDDRMDYIGDGEVTAVSEKDWIYDVRPTHWKE